VDHRRRKATERGYKDLQLARQLIDETEGPGGARLVLRQEELENPESKTRQRELWHRIRYRYVVTNLPPSWSPEEIIDQTYLRCEQENIMAGLGSGIGAGRVPVAPVGGP